MQDDSPQVLELKEKLADLLENSYARDQAMEEALNAKNLEISNLRDYLSRAEKAAHSEHIMGAKLQAEVLSRDATIADLSHALESMRSQIQSDLKSISEYSIECPKCRSMEIPSPSHGHDEMVRQRELTIESLEGELSHAKKELFDLHQQVESDHHHFNAEVERMQRFHADQIQSAVAAAEQEIVRISVSLDAVVSERDVLLDSNEAMSRELKAMSEGIRSAADLVKTREGQLRIAEEHVQVLQKRLDEAVRPVDDHLDRLLEQSVNGASNSDADVAAANAKKVAVALAQYCQQLTSQLRTFRKKEKRGKAESTVGSSEPPKVSQGMTRSVNHPMRAPVSPASKGSPAATAPAASPTSGWHVDEVSNGWGEGAWGDVSVKSSTSRKEASPRLLEAHEEHHDAHQGAWSAAHQLSKKTPSPKAKDAEDDLFSMLN